MERIITPFTSREERYTPDLLPPELLVHIFLFARAGKRRLPHKVPYEVELSHVSRKWRAVALNTSLLWTSISIYSPKSMEWVTSYLQRSGSQTLFDVLIDIYEWDKSSICQQAAKNALAKQIFGLLSPHFARVSKLSIVSFAEQTAYLVQSVFANSSAPNLESLSVDFDHSIVGTDLTAVDKILSGGSPKLAFVNTSFVQLLNPSICLKNLTTLFLQLRENDMLTYPDLVTILTTPATLINLSITGFRNHSWSSWPMHLIEHDPNFKLPNLQSLRLIGSGPLAIRFLLAVSAPRLESAWLDCSFDSFHSLFNAPQMAHFRGGISKFSTVRYLTLREDNLLASADFARTFPNITHLHLPHAHLFHSECLTSALSTSWQNLQSLIFTLARESRWQKFTIALASLLPERSQAGYPIKNLILDKDFRRMLEEKIPDISDMAAVVDLSPETYREPWWSKQIGDSL